jgi:hypothetical protein
MLSPAPSASPRPVSAGGEVDVLGNDTPPEHASLRSSVIFQTPLIAFQTATRPARLTPGAIDGHGATVTDANSAGAESRLLPSYVDALGAVTISERQQYGADATTVDGSRRIAASTARILGGVRLVQPLPHQVPARRNHRASISGRSP